jgi:hypothetical protein
VNISLNEIILILVAHWLADFVFQTDEMAKNKSSNSFFGVLCLTYHAVVYAIVLALTVNPMWAVINLPLHWLVDFVTSRVTKKLWEKEQVHFLFVVIGLDQVIHYLCLFYTWEKYSIKHWW